MIAVIRISWQIDYQEMYKSNQEPDIPAALGLLSHFDNDELKELLNNDGKFEDIVKDIKQV